MKKIEKLLLVIIGVLVLNVSIDVNASKAGATIVDGGTDIYNIKDKNGNSQNVSAQQEIGGVGAYCLDPGYSAAANLDAAGCDINKISSSDFAKIESIIAQLNQINGTNDYYYRQMLLRYWAMDTGLIKAKKSAIWDHMATYDLKINEAAKAKVRSAVSAFDHGYTLEGGSSVFDFVQTSGATTEDSFSYTYKVVYTGAGSIINWNNVEIKLKNKSNNSINYTKNGDTVTVTGTLEECKGASFKIVATTSSDNVSGSTNNGNGNPTLGNAYYYVECGEGYQNYILTGTPDVDFGDDGSGDDDNDDGSGTETYKGSKKIKISDPECNCDVDISGDYVCSGEGVQSEYIHETDNIKSCITSGYYNGDCSQDNIKKTNEGLSDNEYCAVYCTEEIDFKFPGEIEASNGGYFRLDSSMDGEKIKVTGKRICYAADTDSSDGIDQDKYFKNLKDKHDEINDALKNYAEAKKKKELIEDAEAKTSSCTSYACVNGAKKSGAKNNNVSGTYYSESEEYEYQKINYNSKGSVTNISTETATASVSWGTTYSGGACNTCSATTTEKPKVDPDAAWSIVETKVGELEEIIKEYEKCYTWTNNYCGFNPKLYFTYEEVYNKDLAGELVQESITKGSKKAEAGSFYVSTDNYEGVGESINKTSQYYVEISGSNTVGKYEKKLDVEHKYIKVETISEKTFQNNTGKLVCSYHPNGTIQVGNNCSDGKNSVLLEDGYVFPVALEHQEYNRKYNYDITIENIGAQGNDSNCAITNRLAGDPTCSQYNKKSKKIGKAKYTCQYSSCPECETSCVCPPDRPDCYVEDQICKYVECDDCTVSCVGCLWSNGNSTFAYKTISLKDVFPNSTDDKVGYNWNTNSSINPQANKSETTIKDIEKEGQKVYSKPEYSYTLNPSAMAKIRKYNEAANGNQKVNLDQFGDVNPGGYNNNTLSCVNGEKCQSSFLRGLEKIIGQKNYVRSEDWKVFKNGEWKTEK